MGCQQSLLLPPSPAHFEGAVLGWWLLSLSPWRDRAGGFALEGAWQGQAELEGCEQSGSSGLSPPASLQADIPPPWKYA